LRGARITFKDQAFPGGYLKLGDVQESGEKRSCAAAKLGEERGTEQMGGGGKGGVGSSAYISVTRSDKLHLDDLKCTNLFLILLFCRAAGRLRAWLLN